MERGHRSAGGDVRHPPGCLLVDPWARSYTVLRLVAECGDDMTRWPTTKHFTSWLCLAPANKISGGEDVRYPRKRQIPAGMTAFRSLICTICRSPFLENRGSTLTWLMQYLM